MHLPMATNQPALEPLRGMPCDLLMMHGAQCMWPGGFRRADKAVEDFLREANKAASIAATARVQGSAASTSGSSRVAPAPTVQQLTGRTDDRWHCPACSNSNYMWRETCNRCNKPSPLPPAQRNAPTKTVRVAHASSSACAATVHAPAVHM